MTESPSTISPMLRRVSRGAHILLGLMIALWLVVILVGMGLHYVIVPRIAEFRPLLQEQATRALGLRVQIGAIRARSNDLLPSVEMDEVTLLDADGRVHLRLPRVLASLSARSVLRMGLEQLVIEGAELDVRRHADGTLWVAGLALGGGSDDTRAADWVLSQPELVIRGGQVRWGDALQAAAPLVLTQVDWVLRNRGRTHRMRLDATPPRAWGRALQVQAEMRQPLWSRHPSRWQDWQGQVYAHNAQVNLAEIRPYLGLSGDGLRGIGALRAWVDVRKGQIQGVTADVSLHAAAARLQARLKPLQFSALSGRVGMRQQSSGAMEYFTEDLQFHTEDDLHWPGGNVRLALWPAEGRQSARGQLGADRLDLAALHSIAQRLPLSAEQQSWLQRVQPNGLVERLQLQWDGAPERPERYSARGRVVRLGLQSRSEHGAPGPGLSGVEVDFDLQHDGGRAQVQMHGALDAVGLFDEPRIDLQQLRAQLTWSVRDGQWSLQIPSLQWNNADMQADARLTWVSHAPHNGQTLFPGVLDLQANVSQVPAAKVVRYLPSALAADVRDYLRRSITGGVARDARFRVRGDLRDFPFTSSRQGDFRISARLQDLTYAFVPADTDSARPAWPALTQLSAELLIEHETLQVKGARTQLQGSAGLRAPKVEAVIHKLYDDAVVSVNAEVQGPMAEALAIVQHSPLNALLGGALADAHGTGSADYRFKLNVPLNATDRTSVRGSVGLAGNDLQIMPSIPALSRARGTVHFSDSGFTLSNVQARALGGDLRAEGGLSFAAESATRAGAASQLRLQGTASAEGLRQAPELGLVARLAHYAQGASAYSASLGWRHGQPELNIQSSLSGLALTLPEPFSKPPEASLPLQLETQVRAPVGSHLVVEQWRLAIGDRLHVKYERDLSGPQARVLRGAIALGLEPDETVPWPQEGVVANLQVPALNLDAWSEVLARATASTLAPTALTEAQEAERLSYLPTSVALRARRVDFGGRTLHEVLVGGAREGPLWRANLDASELNGYVEYRQPLGVSAGRLFARLARLVVAPSTAQDVENVLDEQPASIPALDIVVEDLELRGKKLGRIEIDAVNLGAGSAAVARDTPREWRMQRFNITTPEASLTASGNWIPVASADGPARARRRTRMNFALDIRDSGALLERFGMKDLVRKGQGKIDGEVAWLGSPITLDYPSMSGQFQINIEAGQFLKADPGLAKLLGVLSLQSLPRRLTLDFRDVFAEGFAFDFVRGDVAIDQGIARTSNLQMKGVNAVALLDGQADIARETQDLRVVVIPEINAGSASLLASYLNPVWGLSTFLAQLILRQPLIDAITQEFHVDGTWVDPRVTAVEHKRAPPQAPAAPASTPKESR